MSAAGGSDTAAPRVIVLMGVAGCGKSTIGRQLAAELDWPFRDADSFHPAANIEKMSRGLPLTDDDRRPWLDAISAWIGSHRANGTHGIVSCSALRRVYRKRLIAGHDDVGLVHLDGDIALIGERMARRKNHFMPLSLLESQFATLERPQRDEHAFIISVALPPKKIVRRIAEHYRLQSSRP